MKNESRILGVGELNALIKALVDSEPLLSSVLVRGELSNYKVYPSGHHYFTLKDADSSLRCVMFKREAAKLRFRPENGMKVIAGGRVSVYPRDGAYQLYCSEINPDGLGNLYLAFEQLKEKLLGEGLFAQETKKPLPKYPERIAVVTSPAGAAVRDIIRVLGARWPLAEVILLPVRVQGAEAPREICAALRYADAKLGADLIITGRGGGSAEDLWAFNDENVARTIFACKTPVISAVGHEPDVTISDFVADLRAATPSNAAELAVPDREEIYSFIEAADKRIRGAALSYLKAKRQRLEILSKRRVMELPTAYIDDKRLRLDRLQGMLEHAAVQSLHGSREKFVAAAAALDALSPLKVLARGYSVVSGENGKIISSARSVRAGEKINVTLSKGSLECTVDERKLK